jgi:hypothetical protein
LRIATVVAIWEAGSPLFTVQASLGIGIERQNMRNVTIRSNDNHAPPVSVDAPHVKNVIVVL